MRATRWILVALALGLLPSLAAASADNAGTTVANFLSVGTGPSVLSRGGATIGLSGDLAETAWNPGALGWIHEGQIQISHASITEETMQEWVNAGGRLPLEMRWSISGLYQGEGTFSMRDQSNNDFGEFNAASMAIGAYLARPIGGVASVGFGAKWVNEMLGDWRGTGVTFDAGLQVRAGMLGFGAAAQNFGGHMKYGETTYDFPTTYAFGVAVDHASSGLRGAVDVNFPNAYYTSLRTGAEWRWREMAAIRAGYRTELGAPEGETLAGPTFGVGAGGFGMWFDYGYLVATQGESQHRIGISLKPGQWRWSPGDPFGQNKIPREYDMQTVAPVAPADPEPKKTEEKPSSKP